MKRKLVCMMLAAAVTAGSLAGCGSQSGGVKRRRPAGF